jgi:hypothetical protein
MACTGRDLDVTVNISKLPERRTSLPFSEKKAEEARSNADRSLIYTLLNSRIEKALVLIIEYIGQH